MKIAMLTTWDEACGIADYAKALVSSLEKKADVKVVPIRHGQRRAAYFKGLAKACNECDIVHIQHEYIFFGGRDPWNNYWHVLEQGLKKPVLITTHTLLHSFRGGVWWKRLLRFLRDRVYAVSGWKQYLEVGQFSKARRVIVHTRAHKDSLVERGLPEGRIVVLPQGVPMQPVNGDGMRARRRWNLDGAVVTMFGFFIPSKGHLLAIEAWAQLQPEATLVFIGKPFSRDDRHYADHVYRAAEPFKDGIRFTGYLQEQEVADLLAASQIVLMPYLDATSSYSLSWLLAQRKAVLASDLACFREIKHEADCLELFRTNDAQDLKAKLKVLLSDPARRTQLESAAGEWSRSHDWDTIASKLMNVYTGLINERSIGSK